MNINPFRPTRYEFEKRRTLIVRTLLTEKLESSNNFYVSGNRGSGKTMLSRSLNWEERTGNRSLMHGLKQISDQFIGVYLKIPEYLGSAFDDVNWLHISGSENSKTKIEHYYFSKFVESCSCQLICDAILSLRERRKLTFSKQKETSFISRIVEEIPDLEYFCRKKGGIQNIHDLVICFKNLHQEIHWSATHSFFDNLQQVLPKGSEGELIRKVSSLAISELDICSEYGREFHFKICIDDCEVLSKRQQISLNTLVRITAGDMYWVLTYVGHSIDATSTYLKDQNLTDADRKFLSIHETFTKEKFIKFCSDVAALRCEYFALDQRDPEYINKKDGSFYLDLDKLLGSIPTNDLLAYSLKGKGSENASSILISAKKLRDFVYEHYSDRDASKLGFSKTILPIYQAYLYEKLYSSQTFEEWLPKDERKILNFSPILRRKQRGALLCLLKEYKIRTIPYAGIDVVMGMADLCIRDFLELMAFIYDETIMNIKSGYITKFVNRTTPIPIAVQTKAIKGASAQKFDGIVTKNEIFVSETMSLVEGLGKYTASMQSDFINGAGLRTAERGVYEVVIPKMRLAEVNVIHLTRVLHSAHLSGLILPTNRNEEIVTSSGTWRFRLHNRFAAYYGYSYQGGYEPVKIQLNRLIDLVATASNNEPNAWKNASEAFLREEIDQADLFEGIT